MTQRATDPIVLDAIELLARYSFDLGAFAAEQLVEYWLRRYPASWVRSAVIEALYQGRYKAVSVGQILAIWGRRGQPIYHFNSEFERIVSTQFLMIHAPDKPTAPSDSPTSAGAAEAEADETEVDEDQLSIAASQEVALESPLEDISKSGGSEVETNGSGSSVASSPMLPFIEPDNAPLPRQAEAEVTAATPHAGSPEIWTRGDATKYPIHRFVPEPEGSLFYVKLRAVAYDETFPETPAASSNRF